MTDNARDPVSGKYAFKNKWDRLCRCGHTLGVHVDGGFDCINVDIGDGQPCACMKFRPAKDLQP